MRNQSSPQLDYTLTQAVKRLIKVAPVFVAADASVGDAAQQMQHARTGSVLVATEPPGIVTDRDLRGRVLAANLGPETPVTQVMTRPLKTIDSDMLAFGALRLMVDENIHHLPVVEEGKIIGVISSTDLLFHQTNNPVYLRRVIDNLDEAVAATGSYAAAIAALADTLFQGGLGALQIAQIVSSLNDALVKRLVQLAEKAVGPPPVPYAWIVFGSEGRMEQTLLTDQDNALVFGKAMEEESRAYFGALSKRVIDGLIQAGFPPCPGGFMAINWCKPLSEWRQLFSQWIRLPEPQALLDAAIFFDFRVVAGNLSLESLEEIISGAQGQRRFLTHMLNGAVAFRPPLGFLNRLRTENGGIDIKMAGIAPIVSLARVAALATGSRERSTLERLSVGSLSGSVIDPESARLLSEIFPFFLRLRLRAQLAERKNHDRIDNRIDLADLSSFERRQLKDALVIIKRIQEDLRVAWRLDLSS
jgi:CBS domain-containing protein